MCKYFIYPQNSMASADVTTWSISTVENDEEVARRISVSENAYCVVTNTAYPIAILTAFSIGLLGNIMSFVVFSRPNMRKLTSTILPRCLAISDTLTLTSYALAICQNHYLTSMGSRWFCKAVIFMEGCFQMTSSYLIMCMTIERFLAVTFPLKVISLVTMVTVRITAAVTFEVGVILSSPYLFVMDEVRGHCTIQAAKIDIFNRWTHVDTTFATHLPVALIFTLNLLVIVQFRRAAVKRRSLSNGSKGDNQAVHITKMLLSVSIVYWLLNTPYAIYLTGRDRFFNMRMLSGYCMAFFVQSSTVVLVVSNNGVNFLLYFLTGQRFRRELFNLFYCGSDPKPAVFFEKNLEQSNPNLKIIPSSFGPKLALQESG
ncbi:hypothetical protein CAPTEDRAFT_203199 [Capitella teleta]|uniref:G-protein coupled receptors family 1 profile domain-containing protein n=1 Tax=Capitella teleta TaxID=283909 RepID=R7TZN0_CAPTE|nr:hypothetical protein CAPTEDRAFT_203199 [Capitella teleta]|eukprot:ELT96836.1 hypothetical protein CAPTEDRAFT_203199 [Capitella teleta]